jgi:hypothetical protein
MKTLRCLWKTDEPFLAHDLASYGMKRCANLPIGLQAQAHRLLGHICLDTCHPRAALLEYEKALALDIILDPQAAEPPRADMATATDVLSSMALCLLELGHFTDAFQALHRATSIQVVHDPCEMTRTHTVRAIAYLRSNSPFRALEELSKARDSKGTTREEIEAASNPERACEDLLGARRARGSQGVYEAGGCHAETSARRHRSTQGDRSHEGCGCGFYAGTDANRGSEAPCGFQFDQGDCERILESQ